MMKKILFKYSNVFFAVFITAVISGCAGQEAKYNYPEKDKYNKYSRNAEDPSERDTIFGKGGIDLFGNKKKAPEGGTSGIGVNSFLWRASLDTLAFMPLSSADPFGGVIITDWYAPPSTPGERFKINAFILGKALRADGIKISSFRQIRDSTGGWVDAPINKKTAIDIENAILARARQLRIASTTTR